MSQRTDRVQRLARRALSELIHDLKDPRIGFATVTQVRVTPDLRQARVLVSVLGTEEERAETMAGLESAKPFLRTELGHQVRMKYVPELTFELDDVAAGAARLEEILHKIHEDDDAHAEAELNSAARALLDANVVTIACHVNPDGDALGSLFACTLALDGLGKETHPTWGDMPASVPPAYAFLPGAELVEQPGDVPPGDVFLALDCGARDRLGPLAELTDKATVVINIDHHPGNDDFGNYNIVRTAASSTAEIVGDLLRAMSVELDKEIATNLYTGVVTDTGRFSYSNASPRTLRFAADLLETGVPAPDIATEVFDSSPWGYLKLVGHVLERAKLHEEERFVYSWITLDDLDTTGVGLDETEKLIDVVRSTRAADVAAMFKEQVDGAYRVSLRSKGPVSVGEIARANGGGGHELAAGFTAPSVEAAVAAILAALQPR